MVPKLEFKRNKKGIIICDFNKQGGNNMPIVLDLRQAIVHKVHNKNDAELREMIEGSVHGPEAALPGLGAIFEMIWKNIETAQQDELIQVTQKHLQSVTPAPLS